MEELPQSRWSDQATLDDIYYCYRLLLGREPGEEGLKFWSERLAREEFTCAKLAAYFRKSKEYVTSARARGIKRVALDDFDLYVYEYDWDIGEGIAETKQYEPHVTSFLKQNLKEGSTFVDVGANIGYFTLVAATQLGSSGRTIAIECSPKNCELIYLSLHRNGLDRVLVYPFAISDAEKLMSFSSGFSNGFVGELEVDEEAVIVPAVTLDFLLRNEARVDMIKMDVEGSEAKAWRGMRQVVEKHHPVILMEFFPALLERNSGTRGDELLSEIFSLGYTATILQSVDGEFAKASSPAEVIDAWRKKCEADGGDESREYLDLAFQTERESQPPTESI
jgi:FkbM family methyltransferase